MGIKCVHNQKDKLFDRIVLGGDVVYDCNDNIEIDNLKRQLDSHNIKFIIGNHDTCSKMLELANKEFGSLNSYEINDSYKTNRGKYDCIGEGLINHS